MARSRQNLAKVPQWLLISSVLVLAGCGQQGLPMSPPGDGASDESSAGIVGSVQSSSTIVGMQPNRIRPVSSSSVSAVPLRWVQPDRVRPVTELSEGMASLERMSPHRVRPVAGLSTAAPLGWSQTHRIRPVID